MQSNDEPGPSQPPRGPIAEMMAGHSQIAKDYFAFLTRVDPVARWEDIVALDEPLQTGKQHPDQALKEKVIQDYFPSLLHTVTHARSYDSMAMRLGVRCAWSRLGMHANVLDAMESFLIAGRPA